MILTANLLILTFCLGDKNQIAERYCGLFKLLSRVYLILIERKGQFLFLINFYGTIRHNHSGQHNILKNKHSNINIHCEIQIQVRAQS